MARKSRAAITKESYQTRTLSRLVNNLFDGRPALLVQQLVDSRQLNADEVQELRSALKARKP
jgi:predicted transcriptional regulator